jgi:hypothetical protein
MQSSAVSPLNTRVVQVSASTVRVAWDFLLPLLFGFYATFVKFQAADKPGTPPHEPARGFRSGVGK